MKTPRPSVISALVAFSILAGIPTRADNMASIAISPGTGAVTLAPQWGIGGSLAGFHQMSQDLSLGGQANDFYSIKGTAIPNGGSVDAFTFYVAASGAATNHVDIGSKLTPDSYSALTSADPDIGYGSVNFYFIHHKGTTDYFANIVPGSDTSSMVTDLKPMSGPGGPDTVTGLNGYFGLTFAATNLGYGLNLFYYLRSDPVTGFTKFGTLEPALLGTSADRFDLGLAGHNALAFTGTDVGFGTDKMYYLRLDPITGFTIFGTLHPTTGRTADIANLGSVYSTLTFVPGDIGFGTGRFYTTGAVNPTWQSVSFAAIADRTLGAGSFTVNPSASSGLPIILTVVSGSATISAPVGGVFTVTPTGTGLITLQATQPGASTPTPYEYNMLRQSFLVADGLPGTPDFNHDGHADILWQNMTTGQCYLWFMDGTTTVGDASLGTVHVDWHIAGAADFNGDGHPDILWQHAVTGLRYLWFMNGTTTIGDASLGTVPVDWHIAATGDLNGDGYSDILWEHKVTGQRHIWFMNGSSTIGDASLGTVAVDWHIAATADFNGDGHVDILWEHAVTGQRHIWFMNNATTIGDASLGTVAADWHITAATDFNGDGHPDILWEHAVTGQRYLWFMDGTATIGDANLGFVPTDWSVAN